MAIGNPLLAVLFEDGYVRTYEWVPANSKFVQMAARSGYSQSIDQTIYEPQVFWMADGTTVAVSRNVSHLIGELAILDPLLEPLDETTISSAFDGFNAEFRAVNVKNVNMLYYGFNLGRMAQGFLISNTSPYITNFGTMPDGSPGDPTDKKLTEIAATPDGYLMVIGRQRPNVTEYWQRDAGWPPAAPVFNYDNGMPLGSLINPDLLRFSQDSKFLLAADKTGLVEIHVFDGESLSLLQILAAPTGTIVDAAFSNDKRHLVISGYDGADYETRTYRRDGMYFLPEVTIADFGGLLSFSQDGSMIVDTKLRKAYTYADADQDSWVEIVDALEDVNVNARAQDVSPHAMQPITISYLYNNAINKFKNNLVDLNAMKLVLLTSAAVFNKTDGTLAQATNSFAWSVSSGGYPAEGVDITFSNEDNEEVRYVYRVLEPYRDIILQSLTARYALVYDDSDADDGPLIFIDLGAERSVPMNTKLRLPFRDDELLILTS